MPNKEEYTNFLANGFLLGNYKILNRLGEGGFGITYKAEHIHLGTIVAIKEYMPNSMAVRDRNNVDVTITNIVNKDDYDFGLDKFLDEAKVLASFKHPNIVGINDFFRENNTAYFVMPFVEGETLGGYASRIKEKLDQNKLITLIVPILEGLRETHSKNILHRDIKLDNIFLSEKGMPILIDFGAARIDFAKKSMSINAVLTPPYAPLEQYGSQEQGPWTDIYALGMVMYRLVTKFPSDQIPPSIDRSNSVYQGDEDPLKMIENPNFSQEFKSVIMKALSISVKDRYQTTEEMIEELISIINFKGKNGSNKKDESVTQKPQGVLIDTDKRTGKTTNVNVVEKSSSNLKIMIAIGVLVLIGMIGSYCFLSENSICASKKNPGSTGSEINQTEENISIPKPFGLPDMDAQKAFDKALVLLDHDAEEEAKEYLEMASRKGHSKAKLFLGQLAYVNKNLREAKKYYYESAKLNDVDGQYSYAEILRTSDNNLEKSKVWYEKASLQGHIMAKISLAALHFQNQEYGDAQKLYESVVNDEKLIIDENKITQKSITKVHLDDAKMNLTYIYLIIDKNNSKAKKMVPRDIPEGQYYMGYILFQEKKLKESKKWMKKAAKSGDTDAQNFIKENF